MDATIIKSLLKCKLSETELKPIQLVEEDLAEGIIECELSVYAMLSLKELFDIRISRISGMKKEGPGFSGSNPESMYWSRFED
ncbi:hypothetical protein LIER_07151 [Lithospermum erythrorhizon]|uniref:Uncharacterized protein n=1 Tax=Lithospermum erythrorhizon TaxID=34254 RepID=A0AAV3P908_LITER